jgi:rubrerythrin
MQELKNNQTNSPILSDDPTGHVNANPNVVKGSEYEKDTLNPEDLSDRWLRWKCLKCGFVYEGQRPLNVCPRCGNDDPDLFDDAS